MASDAAAAAPAGGNAPAEISFERLSRVDHRKADQFRPFKCEQGILKQADGSARFMHGHTSVLTAVFGPMECTRTSQERIDGSFVEVVFNAAVDDDSQKNKEYSEVLRRTFEPVVLRALHPRTLLRIVVQVIKDDGAVLAAATNSVCMALMDAGFPMKTFAVGVSCLVSPKALTLDPTLVEEQAGGASRMFFAFDGNGGDVLASIASGILDDEAKYLETLEVLGKAAGVVAAFMRVSTEAKYAAATASSSS